MTTQDSRVDTYLAICDKVKELGESLKAIRGAWKKEYELSAGQTLTLTGSSDRVVEMTCKENLPGISEDILEEAIKDCQSLDEIIDAVCKLREENRKETVNFSVKVPKVKKGGSKKRKHA